VTIARPRLLKVIASIVSQSRKLISLIVLELLCLTFLFRSCLLSLCKMKMNSLVLTDVDSNIQKAAETNVDATVLEPAKPQKQEEAEKPVEQEKPKIEKPKPVEPTKQQGPLKPAPAVKQQEPMNQVVAPSPKIDKASDQEKTLQRCNNDMPSPKALETPMPRMNLPPLKTPAFNAGQHVTPPNTYKMIPKKVADDKENQPVKAEVAAQPPAAEPIKKFDITTIRRNQQTVLAEKPMKQAEPVKKIEPVPVEPKRFMLNEINKVIFSPARTAVRIIEGGANSKTYFVAPIHEELDLDFEEIAQKIELHCKTATAPKNYQPMKDEVVLAKFEGDFYRAVVKECQNDSVTVFFLEYGNSSNVQKTDIMPLDKELTMPIFTTTVYLQNFPDEVTDDVIAYMAQGIFISGARFDKEANLYVADMVE